MNIPADIRPSPEALLKEAQTEHRGKLKIFLGAAPGVGKTYAMLSAAKNRIAEGIDTVIGLVETHQRSETEALAKDIPCVPRQTLNYRGLTFEEMDLDAILERKPKLALVDELAHTNIPGTRHPKRYQDVLEILEAGIDVYSTLNIQHIESLNDIVARITGVTVRETVPDTIIQMANSIELIDLPPDELLQRLKEGKVYIPEQARLAVNRFFTPGNLTALRELALRQAAERVDDQMTTYMRRHAISGPWPTSNRVMVCISEDKQSLSLVRTARRSAEWRQAPWLVVYVETSRHSFLPESARNAIAQAMEMAESMGAETITATGEDIAGEIIRIARERNVSTIIIGKSARSLWSRLTQPSIASAVLEQGDGFDILLVNNAEAQRSAGTEARKVAAAAETSPWRFSHAAYARAIGVVGMATLVVWVTRHLLGAVLMRPIYTVAILLVVVESGFLAAAFTTILSGIALYAMLCLPGLPPPTRNDYISLFVFLAVGFAVSFVGDRMHRQNLATRRNAERTQSLYDFAKSISAAATIDDVAQVTVRRVATALGARTALLLPRNERLEIVAAIPADLRLDTASDAAMDWAWKHRKPAGWRSDTLPGATFYGLPLQAGANTLGVLAVRVESGSAMSSEQSHFLISLAYQAATAIERAQLVTDIAQARLQTETEKLRASLLSSISHDLRAPLDKIIFTAQDLGKRWNELAPAQQRPQVTHIEQEAKQLDRFVENLLDMAELVTGSIRLNRQPTELCRLIQQAMSRLAYRLEDRVVDLHCPDDLPLIDGDEDALRRVFVNLIENACSYSAPDQPIGITVKKEGTEIKITVTDRGPGIPERERERVFDMFYRVKDLSVASSVSGVGLGLSICRSFIEAHHGRISAQSGEQGKGTSIIIRLPISAEGG